MEKMNNKLIVDRLYEIILEANLNKPPEEVLIELDKNPDPEIEKYLGKIRFYRTKTKSIVNKTRFSAAKAELVSLINSYGDSLKELFSGEEYELLLRFHRNYKESTEKDEQSMLEDKKLLELLKKMKNDLDDRKEG